MTFSNSPWARKQFGFSRSWAALFLLPFRELLLTATKLQLEQVLGEQPPHLRLCFYPVLVLKPKLFPIRFQNAQALDSSISVLHLDYGGLFLYDLWQVTQSLWASVSSSVRGDDNTRLISWGCREALRQCKWGRLVQRLAHRTLLPPAGFLEHTGSQTERAWRLWTPEDPQYITGPQVSALPS